ncbi:MAG: uncharacterized protein JWR20_2470 [Marmoricola sp.]|nr:uncharacterized protein [Marmoricola sp.]
MQPIPETIEALQELARFADDSTSRTLWQIGRSMEEIVPDIVGISVSLVAEELTLTMAATGPSVGHAVGRRDRTGTVSDEFMDITGPRDDRAADVLDEERWHLFAQSTSATGVGSTLSLPIMHDGMVFAEVHLYGQSANAFVGHHHEVAEACGAWAACAVTNADLDFSSRSRAREAPVLLRDRALVDQATGALMTRHNLSVDDADRRLRHDAEEADLSNPQIARVVLGLESHLGTNACTEPDPPVDFDDI